MKHIPHHRLAILAAAFGFAVLATPAARAFTMDTQSNVNADGTARYTDPDEQFSGSGNSNGQSTIRQGNTTLQFGGQPGSFDQRYDNSRMFDPLGGPGRDGYR